MSKIYRRRLRRQQAGVQAPQGGPAFVSPEDQFRMSLDKAKRLKELEQENARLKRLLADAELDKAMLKELAEGNF